MSSTFCALPWRNINTTPMGQCKLCCNIQDFKVLCDDQGFPMNWSTNTLQELWNGAHMQSVRARMLAGETVEDCAICYGIERDHGDSPRQQANRSYQLDLTTLKPQAHDWPLSMELRPSRRCNLNCVTCWSGSSDRVAQERADLLSQHDQSQLQLPGWLTTEWRKELRINLADGTEEWQSIGDYSQRPQSIDNFAQLAPTLQRLYITGGEPTMDSTLYQYIEILRSVGNHRCEISYTTNGTLWNGKLMQLLEPFRTEIQISCDGLGPLDELIRRGTVWEEKQDNLRRYLQLPHSNHIKIFTVISALNCLTIDPLLNYLDELSAEMARPLSWWPIMLDYPRHLSCEAVPRMWRQAAWRDARHRFHSKLFDQRHGVKHAQRVVSSRPFDADLNAKLRQWMHMHGTVHGLDMAAMLPELHEALDADF
jgi:sulfatase maturation enzyme AslB (radical SAM superfamily)